VTVYHNIQRKSLILAYEYQKYIWSNLVTISNKNDRGKIGVRAKSKHVYWNIWNNHCSILLTYKTVSHDST
jgi:hypothetical protein